VTRAEVKACATEEEKEEKFLEVWTMALGLPSSAVAVEEEL
jgi:hypothetical protein